MPDTFTPEERSRIMAKVQSENTSVELKVRSFLHRLGYRYRLHAKHLPGKPDIVFPRSHKVIFVHGCFWHQHESCVRAKRPTSNTDYWNKKLDRNIVRDRANMVALREQGWDVLVVWECEVAHFSILAEKLIEFLTP